MRRCRRKPAAVCPMAGGAPGFTLKTAMTRLREACDAHPYRADTQTLYNVIKIQLRSSGKCSAAAGIRRRIFKTDISAQPCRFEDKKVKQKIEK